MKEHEHEFSFKGLFVPFTTLKAIHWIIVVGVVVYANMLFNHFVWDDMTFILYNNDIHTINLMKIFGWSAFNSIYFRPFPAFYFSLMYSFFSENTFFYHIAQLILHTVNSILVFILLKKFFKNIYAFLLSLIFLVHPIQVESVSYIAQTVNPLFFFFGLLALLLSISEKKSKMLTAVVCALLLFSLLTKETGFLFLVIVCVYEIFIKSKRDLLFALYIILTFIFYLFIRISFIGLSIVSTSNSAIPITTLTFSQKLFTIPKIVYYYLQLFLIPKTLVIDQQWVVSKISFSQFYFPLLLDLLSFVSIGLIGLSVYCYRKERFKAYLFFLVWFILGIVFHMQFLPLDMTVADRFFYFPLVGLLGIIGSGIAVLSLKLDRWKIKVFVICMLVVAIMLFSVRTIIRNSNWYNGITLYTHDSKILDNYDIENNLGNEYKVIGDTTKAIKHYELSLSMLPEETTYFNLGNTYEGMDNIKKAKEYYTKALNAKTYSSIKTKHEEIIYVRLGTILVFTGEYAQARNLMKKALLDYPNSGELYYLLAISEYNLQDKQKALLDAQRAYLISPNPQTSYVYNQISADKPIVLKIQKRK